MMMDEGQSLHESSPPSNPSQPQLSHPPTPTEEFSCHPQVTEQNSRKPRKLESEVWNHFEKIIIDGEEKAKCLLCDHKLSASSKNGTSHLRDHLKLRCSKKHLRVDVKQQLLSFNRKSDGTARVENHNFSQEASRRELANMVIMHEYPLSIVDHIGFRWFMSSLNANFKMISRNNLRKDIKNLYVAHKVNFNKLLEEYDGRIAITTDMWTTSNQKRGYMAITAHFIDDNWVLHNKKLR